MLLVRPPDTGGEAAPDAAEMALHRILVPLDGDEAAEAALPFAAALAKAYGVEVVLLRIVPTLAMSSVIEGVPE